MYGIEIMTLGGSVTTVVAKASVDIFGGGSWGAVANKFLPCVGDAPARTQGTRLTYSSGARGSTPNVTQHVVEGLGVQFNPQLIKDDAVAGRHYLTEKAAYFLEALVQAYQRRPDLAVKYQLGLRVIPNLEMNDPGHTGPDTSSQYRAIQPYVVIPTYAGHGNNAYNLNFDVFQKGSTEVENY